MLAGKVSELTEKVRAFAARKLESTGNERPVVRQMLELANTVNDLLGKPIRAAEAGETASPVRAAPVPTPAVVQAPVLVYFDGKDHRTKTKVEELLRGHDISFQLLDVTNDEAERAWIVTAAKRDEFPIVVIAGTPVGGFAELTQLDVQGELKRRVFTSQ